MSMINLLMSGLWQQVGNEAVRQQERADKGKAAPTGGRQVRYTSLQQLPVSVPYLCFLHACYHFFLRRRNAAKGELEATSMWHQRPFVWRVGRFWRNHNKRK